MISRLALTATVIVAALSCAPATAQQQPKSEAQPFASKGGNCPSGYYSSGGFCTPLNKDSRPAVPKPQGASCPSGWYSSGGACVKLNR